MELYYRIIKNVYKTYTKCIISVYRFLIGQSWIYLQEEIISGRRKEQIKTLEKRIK